LGQGYWLRLTGAEYRVWAEVRPYADVFPQNDEPPAIEEIEVVGGTGVVLSVRCCGTAGESIDVFFQDLEADSLFNPTGGWQIAEAGLAVNGSDRVRWTDTGGSNRSPVTAVFARCYLVGRADVDLDLDGIPDARERLLGGLGPCAASTALAGAEVPLTAETMAEAAEPMASTNPPPLAPTNAVPEPVMLMVGRVIYVDQKVGSDTYTGRRAVAVASDGPKKTIRAGLVAAAARDTVVIEGGRYSEDLDVVGRDVRVQVEGRVELLGGESHVSAITPSPADVSTNF
jgi:hypothetical protein